MKAVIRSSIIDGVAEAPPSKSWTHRFYIAALLANGMSLVYNPSRCVDAEVTLKAVRLMGCKAKRRGLTVKLVGSGAPKPPDDVIHCGGSGTTLRILTAVSALAPGVTVLTGNRSLRRRPMAPLLDALRQLGVECYSARGGRAPVVVLGGTLKAGFVSIRGDISSQYVSGLLYALAMVEGESTVKLTTPLVSKPYVDMTLETLKMCGVEVQASADRRLFKLYGSNGFNPFKATVKGDYSSAAFLMIAAAVTGGWVRIEELGDPIQADRRIVDLLKEVGCGVRVGDRYVEVDGSGGCLKPFKFDASDSPDLVPALAVLASSCSDVSVIDGVSRLRFKESDRVEALTSQLGKMGLRLKTYGDRLIVKGTPRLRGAIVNPYGDHRIAMACAVAALRANGETVILNPSCVRKSYPGFFKDLKQLGAQVELRRSV